jgi:hypothetical protein
MNTDYAGIQYGYPFRTTAEVRLGDLLYSPPWRVTGRVIRKWKYSLHIEDASGGLWHCDIHCVRPGIEAQKGA